MRSLEQARNQVEVLFVGASQIEHAVDPAVFPVNSFNLGHPAETLPQTYAVAEYWTKRLPHLRAVVLAISYFSLRMLQETPEPWRRRFYAYYYPTYNGGGSQWEDAVARHSLAYAYGFGHLRLPLEHAIGSFFGRTASDFSPSGADIRHSPVPATQEIIAASQQRARLHITHMTERDDSAGLSVLRALSRLLQEQKIAFVLVTPPVSDSYAQYLDAERWAMTANAINQLARDIGATYIDDFHDSRMHNHFLDPDHLDERGAVLFTRYLSSVLATKGMFGDQNTTPSYDGVVVATVREPRSGCRGTDGIRTSPIVTGVSSAAYRAQNPCPGTSPNSSRPCTHSTRSGSPCE
jgi:hypothetical protein